MNLFKIKKYIMLKYHSKSII